MNQSKIHKKWIQILKNEFIKKQTRWSKLDHNQENSTHHKILNQIEEKHFSEFLKIGFLDIKDSRWNFTNISSGLKTIEKNTLYPPLSFTKSHKIHFHNGVLTKDSLLQLPDGVQCCTLDTLSPDFPAWSWITTQLKQKNSTSQQQQKNSFYHLAGAFPLNAYILYVPKSTTLSKPLHIHCSFDKSSPLANLSIPLWNFKNFIFLEEKAKITLIESICVPKNISVNMLTHSKNKSQSQLKFLSIDQVLPDAMFINQRFFELEQEAYINQLSIHFGSGISSETNIFNHLESKSHSVLLNLSLLKQQAHQEQKCMIYHHQKEGYSRQFSRGIVNNRAKNNFYGKIYISPQASNTDCAQSAQDLLLSDTAQSYLQPELEIHCSEVKAKHGATSGQFNKEDIFYLKSRGLNTKQALEILMMAYIKNVVNQFEQKDISTYIIKYIQKNKDFYLNLSTS